MKSVIGLMVGVGIAMGSTYAPVPAVPNPVEGLSFQVDVPYVSEYGNVPDVPAGDLYYPVPTPRPPVSEVPEPSPWWVVIAAVAAVGFVRKWIR
jgi:hypothetical protein